MPLPWAGDAQALSATTVVHCSAGAFNFGASAAEPARAVFGADGSIRVQEIFQFPGFCFNGGVIGYLAARDDLSVDEKNALCALPPAAPPPAAPPPPLGAAAGVLGPLDAGHPLAVSLGNLRRWYATPRMGDWLHGLRLFSLCMNGYSRADGEALADANHAGLVAAGVLPTDDA